MTDKLIERIDDAIVRAKELVSYDRECQETLSNYSLLYDIRAELLAKDAKIQRIKSISVEDLERKLGGLCETDSSNRIKRVQAKAIHDLINGSSDLPTDKS